MTLIAPTDAVYGCKFDIVGWDRYEISKYLTLKQVVEIGVSCAFMQILIVRIEHKPLVYMMKELRSCMVYMRGCQIPRILSSYKFMDISYFDERQQVVKSSNSLYLRSTAKVTICSAFNNIEQRHYAKVAHYANRYQRV